MPEHYRSKYGDVIESVLVLLQNGHTLRFIESNFAFIGFDFAAQNL